MLELCPNANVAALCMKLICVVLDNMGTLVQRQNTNQINVCWYV